MWNLCEDNYYYYNLYPYFSDNLFQSLYLFIGYLWTSFVSDNMLFVNLLGGLLSWASIFLVYFSFVRKEDRIKNLHFLSIGILLLGEVSCIYNSCPLTVLWFVLIFIILSKRTLFNYGNTAVIGVVTALSLLSRFPNLCLIPFVILYYIARGMMCKRLNLSLKCSACYLATTIIVYYLLACILCWNYDIFSLITEEFTNSNVSSYTTHSMHTLLSNYWKSFSSGLFNSAWFIGALMIAYICGLVKSKSKLLNIIGLLPLIYLLYKNQYMLLAPWYGWRNIFGFLLLYLILYNAIKENTREYILNSFLLISIALALVAGADSGLKNVVIIFETFSPMLLIEHKRLFGFTYFKKGVIILTVIYSSFVYYAQLFYRNYPYNLMKYERATLLIPTEEKSILEKRLADVAKFETKDHCIFFGYAGHRIQAISGNKLVYKASYWQKSVDEIETDNIVDVMRHDKLCTVFDFNNSGLLRKKMDVIGAKCVSQSEYCSIYLR